VNHTGRIEQEISTQSTANYTPENNSNEIDPGLETNSDKQMHTQLWKWCPPIYSLKEENEGVQDPHTHLSHKKRVLISLHTETTKNTLSQYWFHQYDIQKTWFSLSPRNEGYRTVKIWTVNSFTLFMVYLGNWKRAIPTAKWKTADHLCGFETRGRRWKKGTRIVFESPYHNTVALNAIFDVCFCQRLTSEWQFLGKIRY